MLQKEIKLVVFYMAIFFILHNLELEFEDMIEKDLLANAVTSPPKM